MFPEEFVRILPKASHDEVHRWWQSLDDRTQREIVCFYNNGDAQIIRTVKNINSELEIRNKVEMEVEVDESRDVNFYEFPNQDYYENLIGNEVYLCLRGPTFHICKAHKELRLFLLLGMLPRSFKCFVGKSACAMEENLHVNSSGYWLLKHTMKI